MCVFSDKIKNLREENKLTQQDIADLLNTSKQTISNYESGKNEPNLSTVVAIADYFGVTVDYLVGRTNSKTGIPNSVLLKFREKALKSFNESLKEAF